MSATTVTALAPDVLADSSVLIKWFWAHGESEVESARALRDAHVEGHINLSVLDLAVYEVGNVLVRPLSLPAKVASRLSIRCCPSSVKPCPCNGDGWTRR